MSSPGDGDDDELEAPPSAPRKPVRGLILLGALAVGGWLTFGGGHGLLSSLLPRPTPPAGPSTLQELEAAAALLDKTDNVSARGYVDIYVKLADAYLAAGKKVEARAALERALRLDSWNTTAQEKLLDVDLALGHDAEAYRRADFMARILAHDAGAESLVRKAKEVLARLEKQGIRPARRPALPDKKILVLGYDGTDAALVQTLASRVREEFGIQVEVLADRPAPTLARVHDRRAKLERLAAERGIDPSGSVEELEARVRAALARTPQGRHVLEDFESRLSTQLDAESLRLQALACAGERLRGAGVVGVLAVTDKDMATEETNFLFGLCGGGAAIMSYARFAAPQRAVLVKRAVMQAFSSAGRLVGLPSCSVPSCARAYPNSLEEHDRKVDELCPECLSKLAALAR